MATYTKFQQFVEDLAHGVHNFDTNTIKVALSSAANAPSASDDAVLTDITTVSTANLDGVTLTKGSSGQTTGTYKYVPNDLTMTASGAVGPFQYVIIYNDTATSDPLICFFNYGTAVTLAANDTFKLDFGTELFSLA
jgi:hypothetical protein